jgi:ribosome-binding ATPase YchF (GTP1/OBG family)|tara:strand:+ start:213 stop:902 length:690 start_codon:yes stop_codon:yes gene_type:complete
VRIGFTGIDLPEGKTKYRDETLLALEMKDKPKKVSPFFAEFVRDEFIQAEAIVIPGEAILDLLILDMEKLETRLARLDDAAEKDLLARCLADLERDIPLCDMTLDAGERATVESADPLSLKPVVCLDGNEDIDAIISLALDKANYMFFYTSGPTESHAWLVEKGSDIVTCAGRIHSDLARGFIKGDVVSFDDYMNCHNFNDCKAKGLARLTDRDYIIQPREIIEIRFNT